MDIIDCLITLEKYSITDEQIVEKMGCNKSTIQSWWKNQKASPRYLAKMQKFCAEFLPISIQLKFDRPTEEMFCDALHNAIKQLGDTSVDERRSLCWIRHKLGYKGYYDKGIPATTKRFGDSFRGHWPKPAIETEYAQELCSKFHPDEGIRNYFISVLHLEP